MRSWEKRDGEADEKAGIGDSIRWKGGRDELNERKEDALLHLGFMKRQEQASWVNVDLRDEEWDRAFERFVPVVVL